VVARAGILSIGTGVRGDHRNVYIDVQAQSFMGNPMYIVVPPPMRRLKLGDYRVTKKFNRIVRKHIESNNIMQRANNLSTTGTYPATESMLAEMENIDEQVGRAIRSGLKKCRTLCTGTIPYSALFATLSKTNRLWHLVFKKKKGQRISNTTIRRLSAQVGIKSPLSLPMEEVVHKMRESKKQYESFIPHAPTERQRFYEDLAASNALVSNKSKASILQQIMQAESSRYQHASIRRAFPKKMPTSKKVDRVQVQRGSTWEEITSPSSLVAELQQENKKKYSCTEGTPLMQRGMHEQMGNFAEGSLSKELQYGHVQPEKIFDEWTAKMIGKTKIDASIPTIPTTISADELRDAWRASKENKTASPSGRYNATYKAMATDDHLLQMITTMINIPFLLGAPYKRWSTFLDIMAFKKSNSIQIQTLRSIIISEGDWNVAGRIFVARRMMQQAEKLHLLPEEHLGGRKGRKAIDGAITKRLYLDNSRLMKKPTIILSTDAANCYDRMVHKFVCMMCKKWGLEEKVLRALLKPLQTAQHFTRTAYGDSKDSFTGSNLQGAGQGNTSASPFWTCISSPMIEIMKDHNFQAKMTCPLSLQEVILTLMAFVDDTEVFLMIDDDDVEKLIELADTTLKAWKGVLQATGGDMRSKKCAWILLHYSKKTTKYNDVQLQLQDEDGVTRNLEKYSVNDAREYLGVQQQASGSETEQLAVLREKVDKWNCQIKHSKLTRAMNYSAIFSRIHKSLQYPLPATTISENQLQELSDKLYEESLPRCGINRKFPISFRDLPSKYQGLGLPNLYMYQETEKLMEIVSKSFTDHIMWKQFRLGMELLQLYTGALCCVVNTNFDIYAPLVEATWITSQWEFLYRNDIKLNGWDMLIEKQRENDMGLMEMFVNEGYRNDELILLNKCRMYLQVLTVSDVVDGDGTHLCPITTTGKLYKGRHSKFKWPKVTKPTIRAWYEWRTALRKTLCTNESNDTLKEPLGLWTCEKYHDWDWLFHTDSQSLYHLVDGHCRRYRVSSRRNMELRTHARLFKAVTVISQSDIPGTVTRAIAEYENNNYNYVKFYGSTGNRMQSDEGSNTPCKVGAFQFTTHQAWMHASTNLHDVHMRKLHQIMEEPLRIVADGSYKENHSAMATIIEPVSQKHQIVIAGPTPANTLSPTHSTDPYRSEMSGLLAGMELLSQMERLTGKSTTVTMSSDNDAALKVATDYNYFNSKMKHYDVARSLIMTRKSITSEVVAEKVIGHADAKKLGRPFTRAELLNQSCDRLAKKARITCEPCGPAKLQNEGMSLWHNDIKINHDMQAHIAHIFHERRAADTLCEKYDWSLQQFRNVDWDASQRSMKMMTTPTRIWITKYITHFLPIGRNMKRIGQWTMDHCPRCGIEEETHNHLMRCSHAPSRTLLECNISKLRDWLEQMHTPADLETQIITQINQYFGLPSIATLIDHHLISTQLTIGPWKHFMQGRLHVHFSSYMQKIYDERSDTRKTGSLWVAGLIQRIWTLLYRPIWDLRNQYVHKKMEDAKESRIREDLQQRVRQRYSECDPSSFLVQDQHLFQKPLTETIAVPNMSLRAWLLSYAVAVTARDRRYEATQHDPRQTLRAWIVPGDRRKPTAQTVLPPATVKRRVRRKTRHRITLRPKQYEVTIPKRTVPHGLDLKQSGFYRPP